MVISLHRGGIILIVGTTEKVPPNFGKLPTTAQDYMEYSGVNLASLVVAGTVSISLMVSIFVLVYLGNEADLQGIGLDTTC